MNRNRPRSRRPGPAVLTREDIGYGPPRPYEYGPGMRVPRERRFHRAPAGTEAPPRPGLGPYHARLQRRRRPDHWIRADVEEALFRDTWVDADRITVHVDHGVVDLIGTLPNEAEIRRAIRDAESVDGVVRVRNRLEVEA